MELLPAPLLYEALRKLPSRPSNSHTWILEFPLKNKGVAHHIKTDKPIPTKSKNIRLTFKWDFQNQVWDLVIPIEII